MMNRKNSKKSIAQQSQPFRLTRRPVIPDNKPAPLRIDEPALKRQCSFLKVNHPTPKRVLKTKFKSNSKNAVPNPILIPSNQNPKTCASDSHSSDESDDSASARRELILQAFNELYLDEEDIFVEGSSKFKAPRRENYKYIWDLDSNVFNNLLNEESDASESGGFSCGLLADRGTKWHLELTSEPSDQSIGAKLVLDEILWKSANRSETEKIELCINIQLLDKLTRKILISSKSPGAIIFGKSDNFESYGWSDFLPYDSANTYSLQGLTLQLVAKLDIIGSSFPRLQSLTKSLGSAASNQKNKSKLKSEDLLPHEFFDQETLLKNTINLWRSGNRSDVTVVVGDKEFKAHRVILRAQSKKFAIDLSQRSTTKVQINGFDPIIVENGLEFMYATTCPMFNDLSRGDELLRFGDAYGIYSLKSCLMNHIYKTLSIENSLNSILFAHVHDADPRVITGIISFCQRNKSKIIELKEFHELNEVYPGFFSRILSSENKYVFTQDTLQQKNNQNPKIPAL